MRIIDIIQTLETLAPPVYQESYDNSGLLTGNKEWNCTGVLCNLDVTEAVVEEAVAKGCNLIVAHHPLIFKGIKSITGDHFIERTLIAAIKQDIAIYAIHTNLDNVIHGVNSRIADRLGLVDRRILAPMHGTLMKLFTFVPLSHESVVKTAIFEAGAGHIGHYSHCSFAAPGKGSFKGDDSTHPFVGSPNELHEEDEVKIEVIFPGYLQNNIIKALLAAHPYEEVAYDVITLANNNASLGSGMVAELPEAMEPLLFLQMLKTAFELTVIKHTPLITNKLIKKVALCGGTGSFLIPKAIQAKADIFITADLKYHEFFEADNQLVLADIGHWESEQYTSDLIIDILQAKFPTFAVLKSGIKTNPVQYFLE